MRTAALAMALVAAAALALCAGAAAEPASKPFMIKPTSAEMVDASLSADFPLTPATKLTAKLKAGGTFLAPFGPGVEAAEQDPESRVTFPRGPKGAATFYTLGGGVSVALSKFGVDVKFGAEVNVFISVPHLRAPISSVVESFKDFVLWKAADDLADLGKKEAARVAEALKTEAALPAAEGRHYHVLLDRWAAAVALAARHRIQPWLQYGRHAPFHQHLWPTEEEDTYRFYGARRRWLGLGHPPLGEFLTLRFVGARVGNILHDLLPGEDPSNWEFSTNGGATWVAVSDASLGTAPAAWRDILRYVRYSSPPGRPVRAAFEYEAEYPAHLRASTGTDQMRRRSRNNHARSHGGLAQQPPASVKFLGHAYTVEADLAAAASKRASYLRRALAAMCEAAHHAAPHHFNDAAHCVEVAGGRALHDADKAGEVAAAAVAKGQAWGSLRGVARLMALAEGELRSALGETDRHGNASPFHLSARTMIAHLHETFDDELVAIKAAAARRIREKGTDLSMRTTLDFSASFSTKFSKAEARASVVIGPGVAATIKAASLERSILTPFLGVTVGGGVTVKTASPRLGDLAVDATVIRRAFPAGGAYLRASYPKADDVNNYLVIVSAAVKAAGAAKERPEQLANDPALAAAVGAFLADAGARLLDMRPVPAADAAEASQDKSTVTEAVSGQAGVFALSEFVLKRGATALQTYFEGRAKAGAASVPTVSVGDASYSAKLVLGVDHILEGGSWNWKVAKWSFVQVGVSRGYSLETLASSVPAPLRPVATSLLHESPLKGDITLGGGIKLQLDHLPTHRHIEGLHHGGTHN